MYDMRRTFSHVRHRVSLVSVPSNMRCMKVAPGDGVLEVDVLSIMTGGLEAVEEESTERDTGNDVNVAKRWRARGGWTHGRHQKPSAASFLLRSPRLSGLIDN